jgi:3-hydroxyisobutyrate dehydrogenase-like beta-hydroxyacid dehydrogenase
MASDGLSDGRAISPRRPRGHRLQPHRREGRKVGGRARRQGGATPKEAAEAPSSSSPASATTTTSARDARRGRWRLAGMKKGAILIDNTTASATVARELHAAAKAEGLRFPRRAGFGRTGGRRERPADGHGRRRRGRLRAGRAGDRRLRQDGRLMGPAGAGQLTKMVNQICIAGLVQGLSEASTSPKRPASTSRR